MGKKRVKYEIRGYKYAPESFRAFIGLPGQKMEQILLSDEQRQLLCRESDTLKERLCILRMFREYLAKTGGRIEQSTQCEFDKNFRPVHVRKNYVVADLNRPLVVWLYAA